MGQKAEHTEEWIRIVSFETTVIYLYWTYYLKTVAA